MTFCSNILPIKYIDGNVVYHTRISYRTRMVCTVCVYAYGTTVRVWYGYLYHMSIPILYYYCLYATCSYS